MRDYALPAFLLELDARAVRVADRPLRSLYQSSKMEPRVFNARMQSLAPDDLGRVLRPAIQTTARFLEHGQVTTEEARYSTHYEPLTSGALWAGTVIDSVQRTASARPGTNVVLPMAHDASQSLQTLYLDDVVYTLGSLQETTGERASEETFNQQLARSVDTVTAALLHRVPVIESLSSQTDLDYLTRRTDRIAETHDLRRGSAIAIAAYGLVIPIEPELI